MSDNTDTPGPEAGAPLRDIVAGNLRMLAGRERLRMADLAARLGKDRAWVHRRWHAAQEITTEDIDLLAAVLGVSTDELTRRP